MEQPDARRKFLAKFYEHKLPDHLLKRVPPTPRGPIAAVVGWLLLDWFTEKVKVAWVPDDLNSHFHFTIKRWGEDFSFNLAPGSLVALAYQLGKNLPQSTPTMYAASDISGVVVVPDWAFHRFLQCVVPLLPELHKMARELEEAFTKQGETSAPTLH